MDDGVRSRGHRTRDFNEMGVHGLRVGMGHDRRGGGAAFGAGGAEDVGPFVAGVARGAGAAAARSPVARQRALLAHPGGRRGKRSPGPFSGPAHSWNHTSRGLPRARSGRVPSTFAAKFFKRLLGLGVGFRVVRRIRKDPGGAFPRRTAHREAAKAQACQLLAHRALLHHDLEAPRSRVADRRGTSRTTPSVAGSGPSRTICANSAFCSGLSRGAGPAERRFDTPSSPSAL